MLFKKKSVPIETPEPGKITIDGAWLEEYAVRIASYALDGQPISIGIAGCQKGDGASTVTLNLARILSQRMQCRVVAIDANASAPALHKVHGIPLSPGLTDAEGSGHSPDTVGVQVDANMHVVSAGATTNNLMATATALRQMVSTLTGTAHTSVVLVDLPPLASNAEAGLLAKQLDGVCLVMRAEQTRWEQAERVVANLRAADVPIMGVILNHYAFHIPQWLYRIL
jgi:Mrp family chromosome partitioning ATPase